MMRRTLCAPGRPAAGVAALAATLLLAGCSSRRNLLDAIPEHRRDRPEIVRLEVTAYCHCGRCCNWRRNWRGRPVIASGPGKGRPKQIGITASGSRVRVGTLAADTRLFPFGTIMHVPGYGYGRVEDRGSAIVGHTLDVYFPCHRRALEWGRQSLEVRVWRPDPR